MASPPPGRARVDPLAGPLTAPFLKGALSSLAEALYRGLAKTLSREGIFQEGTTVTRAVYETAVDDIREDLNEEFKNLYPRLVTNAILGEPPNRVLGSRASSRLGQAYQRAVARYKQGFDFKRPPPRSPRMTTRERLHASYNMAQPGRVRLGNRVLDYRVPYPLRGYAVETGLFAASYLPFGHDGHGRMQTRVEVEPVLVGSKGHVRVNVGDVFARVDPEGVQLAGRAGRVAALREAVDDVLERETGERGHEVTFRVTGRTQVRTGGDRASSIRRARVRRDRRRGSFPYYDESLAQQALAEAIRRAARR